MEKETTIYGLGFKAFPTLGIPFRGPYNIDYNMLGSIWGPYLGKSPSKLVVSPKNVYVTFGFRAWELGLKEALTERLHACRLLPHEGSRGACLILEAVLDSSPLVGRRGL